MQFLATEENAIYATKNDICRFAEDLSEKLDLKNKTIKTIVEELGGTITLINPFDSENIDLDGSMIVKKETNSFEISLSSLTSDVRDNFTIAHELGHLFLHTKNIDNNEIRFNRYGSNRLEWEANWFASAFLMPEKRFREKVKEIGTSTALLSLHFNVSEQAVQIRKENLGI